MLKFYTLLLPLLIKPTRMGQWAEKMEYKHNQIGLAITTLKERNGDITLVTVKTVF